MIEDSLFNMDVLESLRKSYQYIIFYQETFFLLYTLMSYCELW